MSAIRRSPGLRTRLRMAGEEITAGIREEMESFGAAVLTDMRSNVRRDTGQAADQLAMKVSRDGLSVKIGVIGLRASRKAWYLKFQEFGTRKTPASPFMVPAFERNRERVLTAMATAVKRGISKAGI